jgi:pimeloyl-ACP methyl ester carboxylesterase
VRSFRRKGLRFDVTDGGPSDAPAIVLLHGWPGGGHTWDDVVTPLHHAGYRTIVPDQRGYSEGARPGGRASYVMAELVADVVALVDAGGLDRVHLVGHDWGGAVAWATAARHPERIASLTVLSTPHPRALAAALTRSDQLLRSSYVGFFQLPFVPERVLLAGGGAVLRSMLTGSGLDQRWAQAYVDAQREPGALRSSLAWYRAVPLSGPPAGVVRVPTRYLWSSGDTALNRTAAELTVDHVAAPYRFEVVEAASHWLPEQLPFEVASAVLDHVASLPAEWARRNGETERSDDGH